MRQRMKTAQIAQENSEAKMNRTKNKPIKILAALSVIALLMVIFTGCGKTTTPQEETKTTTTETATATELDKDVEGLDKETENLENSDLGNLDKDLENINW